MLESQKKMYEQKADSFLLGWRKANKNDLINEYIKYEHTNAELADAYISAILCRYWHNIGRYYSTSKGSVSVETCYDWLLRSVLYAIQRRPWLVPESNLYGDPAGPDKTVNQVIKSTRLGYYQYSNANVRKLNYGNASVEGLIETLGEAAPLPQVDSLKDIPMSMDISNFIRDAFQNREYVLAFMVDGIVNYEVFDHIKEADGCTYMQFSPKRLTRHIRSLSKSYCEIFSDMYKIKESDVEKAAQSVKDTTRIRLKTAMKRNMKLLQTTKALSLKEE